MSKKNGTVALTMRMSAARDQALMHSRAMLPLWDKMLVLGRVPANLDCQRAAIAAIALAAGELLLADDDKQE